MKRWRVVVKRQAEADITKIWNIIFKNNLKAAEAFLDAIEEASALLAPTPEIGSPRYFSHPDVWREGLARSVRRQAELISPSSVRRYPQLLIRLP